MVRSLFDFLDVVRSRLVLARRQRALRSATLVESTWDGSRITLGVNQSADMPSTPVGTICLVGLNAATTPDEGELAMTSGGSAPTFLELPALTNTPVLFGGDYQGNNLRVTNISKSAPIQVAIYAPGFGTSAALPDDGAQYPLRPGGSRQTRASTTYQRLVLADSGQTTTFVVYLGPKASVYTLNASTPPPAVPGMDNHSTGDNSTSEIDNWNGEVVYVANLSSLSATGAVVSLTQL